jgi:hypothetical protein
MRPHFLHNNKFSNCKNWTLHLYAPNLSGKTMSSGVSFVIQQSNNNNVESSISVSIKTKKWVCTRMNYDSAIGGTREKYDFRKHEVPHHDLQ